MKLSSPTQLRIDRSRRRAGRTRPVVCASTVDAQRCGHTEDQALYACECGYAFRAEVTTSVGCPHCGTQQAW